MSTDLHDKLDELEKNITRAKDILQKKNAWHESDSLTETQLRERYDYLKAELDKEIQELEDHGHHVSNFEASVRMWLEKLDL